MNDLPNVPSLKALGLSYHDGMPVNKKKKKKKKKKTMADLYGKIKDEKPHTAIILQIIPLYP